MIHPRKTSSYHKWSFRVVCQWQLKTLFFSSPNTHYFLTYLKILAPFLYKQKENSNFTLCFFFFSPSRAKRRQFSHLFLTAQFAIPCPLLLKAFYSQHCVYTAATQTNRPATDEVDVGETPCLARCRRSSAWIGWDV